MVLMGFYYLAPEHERHLHVHEIVLSAFLSRPYTVLY